jgi:hypothetical protein
MEIKESRPSEPQTGPPPSAVPGVRRNPMGFMDVVWQKAAMLVGFYWLFRWLAPSILPESMRALKFQESMFACIILGFIWGGISFLLHRPPAAERAAVNEDRAAAIRKAQVDHYAKKYRGVPRDAVPDLSRVLRKRYRLMAIGGGLVMALGLLLMVYVPSRDFPVISFLLLMIGTITGTLGVMFLFSKGRFPKREELIDAIATDKKDSPNAS